MAKLKLKTRLPILGLAMLSGCSWFGGDDKPARVTASSFYAASPTTAPAAIEPQLPKRPAADARPLPEEIEVRPAAPASRRAPVISVGSYMTIGGVLAEVNGVPIFASRVMPIVERELRAVARTTTAEQFRYKAEETLDGAINEQIKDELLYAAAQHNLEQDDKKLADALTTDYRQKLILDAGGSIQNARKVAADQGDDFEDVVRRKNREYLDLIFLQKKVFPRIQVTTADMRRYYSDKVGEQFTQRASVNVRIIKVDPARSGGKAAAVDRIKALRDRVTTGGEDFAKVAGTENDDGLLRDKKGAEVIKPGSDLRERLEAAALNTEVGKVSDVIDDIGGLYLLKVESRTAGKVLPFEDAEVQERVARALRSVQQTNVQKQYYAELQKNAVIRQDEKMRNTALELIAQSYPIWHAQ